MGEGCVHISTRAMRFMSKVSWGIGYNAGNDARGSHLQAGSAGAVMVHL